MTRSSADSPTKQCSVTKDAYTTNSLSVTLDMCDPSVEFTQSQLVTNSNWQDTERRIGVVPADVNRFPLVDDGTEFSDFKTIVWDDVNGKLKVVMPNKVRSSDTFELIFYQKKCTMTSWVSSDGGYTYIAGTNNPTTFGSANT